MNCAFCQSLKAWKELNKESKYTVAIVISDNGRITDYRKRGLGYTLKYCPTCGKELK